MEFFVWTSALINSIGPGCVVPAAAPGVFSGSRKPWPGRPPFLDRNAIYQTKLTWRNKMGGRISSFFKGTVSWDRFQKFWQKFTELGLNKGHGWFLNFLEAPLIFKWQGTSSFRLMLKHADSLCYPINPNSLWWVHMGISLKERQITEEPMKVKIWKKLQIHKHLV